VPPQTKAAVAVAPAVGVAPLSPKPEPEPVMAGDTAALEGGPGGEEAGDGRGKDVDRLCDEGEFTGERHPSEFSFSFG
jgi:hypothetical protein